MEGGGGGEIRAESGRRRLTLLDQMSAIADGRELSGLTLDEFLRSRKRAVPEPPPPPPPPPPPLTIQSGRTLLDIIRDEDPKADSCKEFVGNRDRKSWRNFKDRLKLKRTGSGAAWTSSVHVPTSDILSPSIRSPLSRRNLVRNESAQDMTYLDDTSSQGLRPQISLSRRTSCRFGPNSSFASDPTQNDDASGNNNNNNGSPPPQVPTLRHQISRRHSTRFSPVIEDSVTDPTELPPPMREGSRRLSAVLAEERSLSAREAVAAQEAAEAAAAAAAASAAAAETADEAESTAETAAAPEQQVVRMSLMDLLEETDRQMGFVGARYMFDEEEDYEEEIEEEEEDGGVGGGGGAGGVDQNCCVCMVRHKGAAFIPCGHTFCRLCSRELWVSRGNCPLCNGFILEILDIF